MGFGISFVQIKLSVFHSNINAYVTVSKIYNFIKLLFQRIQVKDAQKTGRNLALRAISYLM